MIAPTVRGAVLRGRGSDIAPLPCVVSSWGEGQALPPPPLPCAVPLGEHCLWRCVWEGQEHCPPCRSCAQGHRVGMLIVRQLQLCVCVCGCWLHVVWLTLDTPEPDL